MPVTDDDFPGFAPWPEVMDNVFPIRDDVAPSFDAEAAKGRSAVEDPELPGCADPSEWQNTRAPARRFIIDGWVVRGAAGLLSGQEGVGKSLLAQQMATCAAIGRSFLGLEIEHVNAAYITCEDPIDELWRRQESINVALGITMADIAGKLLLVSLQGELGNELGAFDQSGRLTPSVRFRQIRKRVMDFGASLTFLDNAAHMFAGNENARHDVAAFLGLLERLSIDTDGAVVLLAHPNKQHAQGNKQGNEYSGSTGWSAHVRNRLFLDWKCDDADGVPADPDARILRKSKANYGKMGEEIDFRWHEWAFTTLSDLPSDTAASIARAASDAAGNALFLACLDKATEELRATSTSPSASSFAPRLFAKMTTAKGASLALLEGAMNRLLHLGQIRNDQPLWQRKNRVWVTGIARVEGAPTLHQPSDAKIDENGRYSAENSQKGGRTNPAPTFAPTLHENAPTSFTNPALCAPPSTTYIGDGLEPPQSMFDQEGSDEPPAWMDEAPMIDPDAWRNDVA